MRVVKFGSSVEFCGGTHVSFTGNIGLFKILSESATSAGVRRIEAVTGARAEEYVYGLENTLKDVQQFVNNPSVTQAVKKILEDNTELHKELDELRREKLNSLRDKVAAELKEEDGMVLCAREINLAPAFIKDMAFALKPRFPRLVMVIGSNVGGKATLTVMLGDEIVAQGVNASQVIREAAKEINGGGGGQPFFATAGGKNPEGMEKAILKAVDMIKEKLK